MEDIKHKDIAPEIFNLKGWIPCVEQFVIEELFTRLLKESGFSVVHFSNYQFPVKGFTAYWLLAESHLAIHSFAESKFSYIELSSCNFKKAQIFLNLSEKVNYNITWDDAISKSEAPEEAKK